MCTGRTKCTSLAPQRISFGSAVSPAKSQPYSAAVLQCFPLHVGAIQQPFAFIGSQTLSWSTVIPQPRAQPSAALLGLPQRRTPGQSPGRVFRFHDPVGFRQVSYFKRQTTRSSKPLNVPCARPALSSSAVKFAAKDSPGCAVLLVAALQCRFPPEKFLRHSRLLLIFVAHREAEGFREA